MQPKPAGKTNTKALLILSTTGGYPKEGFKIANQLLNKAYPDGFDIYIPGQCKSTGTMIALGANCLFMNQFSELGPLDIQLLDRENLGFRRSGLDYKYVFESLGPEFSKLFVAQTLQIRQQSEFVLTTKQAAEYAAEFVTASMKSVFEQLNPLDISRDYRDLMIMKKYGNFLAEKSGNIGAESIDKLINDYPSHDYVIDDIEAKKLFNRVFYPDNIHSYLTNKNEFAIWRFFTNAEFPFVISITLEMYKNPITTGEKESQE